MIVTLFIYINIFQFMQQYRHYKSTKLVFEMKPDQNNKSMDDLVMFLAQVSNHSIFIFTFTSTIVWRYIVDIDFYHRLLTASLKILLSTHKN